MVLGFSPLISLSLQTNCGNLAPVEDASDEESTGSSIPFEDPKRKDIEGNNDDDDNEDEDEDEDENEQDEDV